MSHPALPYLRLTALCLLLFSGASHSSEKSSGYSAELRFYTYHDKPPYYFSGNASGDPLSAENTGLYQTFINLLNQTQKKHKIVLKFMPRKRLDLLLESGELPGALIGVNPLWFKDKQKTRYLWSAPILWDKDVIAVRSGKAFDYRHPDDLVGRRLALPRGYYFWGVTENIKAGKQSAVRTSSELQNLKLLAVDRADATILSQLTLTHYENSIFEQGAFHPLPVPHDEYMRAVMFPKRYAMEYADLKLLIEELGASAQWQEIVLKVRGQPEAPQ